jgi:hypothetical protein
MRSNNRPRRNAATNGAGGGLVRAFVIENVNVGTSILVLLTALTLAAQPPPPGRGPGPAPPPGGPSPPGAREAVRRRLADSKPADATAKNILALAKVYLGRSDQQRSSPFAATRYLVAADALSQAVEHQQHLLQKGGPTPDRAELTRHLERVYFRLQQADYFVKQSADPNTETIAGFARQYYQEALRAGADLRTADECAKSTEELIRALESLAQSTAPPAPKPQQEKP